MVVFVFLFMNCLNCLLFSSRDCLDGKDGLFPHIPPDAELCFDLTLLGYRPRAIWAKPLIQEPGLSEEPYWEDPAQQPVGAAIVAEGSKVLSSSGSVATK